MDCLSPNNIDLDKYIKRIKDEMPDDKSDEEGISAHCLYYRNFCVLLFWFRKYHILKGFYLMKTEFFNLINFSCLNGYLHLTSDVLKIGQGTRNGTKRRASLSEPAQPSSNSEKLQ